MDKTEESGPERGTTEGRHHCNRDQQQFNILLLASLMSRFFGAPYPNFIGASRAFINVALWAFIFGASRAIWAGPCNYCNFYLTQPIGLYWQLDYGCYSIWRRLMQLICTMEDPFWEHFETYFYSYETSSK